MQYTNNQGRTYEHSLHHALEFFSKAGSLFERRKSYYNNEESALSLFQKSWIVDKETSLKLLFWLRDCRGGAGNRSAFRECLAWLAQYGPEWLKVNLATVPNVGRWDDLVACYDTPCEFDALSLWSEAIKAGDGLAAKWAGRRDNKLRKQLGLSPKEYRKLLVHHTKVVETAMCSQQWHTVEYSTIPSVAMARYAKAFRKHDEARFERYKKEVASGEATIHSEVLFPHDAVRTAQQGDKDIADLQFQQLPDYLKEKNKRIMCLCDTSGSMSISVSGKVQAVDISMGLSLYFSDRLPKDSPFYRKFIQFEDEERLTDWTKMKFSDVVTGVGGLFNGAMGSTNVQKALETLLSYGSMFRATPEQMPNVILIVSDMQFDVGVAKSGQTEIESTLDKWEDAGFARPIVIYWNTAGYAGTPATAKSNDVALVSGFSPATMQAIFSGEDVSPEAIMYRTINKYSVTPPEAK